MHEAGCVTYSLFYFKGNSTVHPITTNETLEIESWRYNPSTNNRGDAKRSSPTTELLIVRPETSHKEMDLLSRIRKTEAGRLHMKAETETGQLMVR